MTEETEYRVIWEIDVPAESPEEAVRRAVGYLEPIEPARWCYLVHNFQTGEVSSHEGESLF